MAKNEKLPQAVLRQFRLLSRKKLIAELQLLRKMILSLGSNESDDAFETRGLVQASNDIDKEG